MDSLKRKEAKLLEQYEEAQALKLSVDKRAHMVASLVHQLLGDRDLALHGLYIRCKIQLLIHQKLLQEKIFTMEQQIATLASF